MKRLWNHAGETLVETMFSLVIISVTFVFLTGAVVAATRVNSKIRNSGSEFRTVDSPQPVNQDEPVTVTITVTDSDNPENNEIIYKQINIYQSKENGYYYYRKEDSESGGGGG